MVLAEDLRQAVLQAALQGKLTEQLEKDSNVDEMLINIQKEREILIADKKIKKEKKLPEIQEEEIPFEIPDNWRWVRLQSFLDVRDGTHDSPKYVENGIPFVTSKNLNNGKIDFSDVKYITKEDADFFNARSKVDKGDILMAMIGSIGKPVLVDIEQEFAIKNMALFKPAPKSNINMNFVLLLLEYAENIMKNQSTGGVQKFVSLAYLREFMSPLPPAEEQKRIVDKINEIMSKIDEYEKIEKELEVLKKDFPTDMKDALLQAAMQGKLTEQLESDGSVEELLASIQKEKEELIAKQKIKKEKSLPDIEEEEIPFDIPENWRWVRWGNLAYSIQYGYNAPAQETGRIKMVRISDIQENSVNWGSVPYCDIKDEEIETYLLQKNDILFARTGGTVGKSFLVNDILEDTIYAGYLIRTRYNNQLVPRYLKLFMESQLYWVQLQNGKTQGCQPNCNGQTLSKMIIPLPPIEEQHRIVEKLNVLLPLCESLNIG